MIYPLYEGHQSRQETDPITELSRRLESLLRKAKYEESLPLADSLANVISINPAADEKNLVNPLYLIAISYSTNQKEYVSLGYFHRALDILKKYPADSMFYKVNYNLGRTYYLIGDNIKSDYFFSQSLNYIERTAGTDNPDLVARYLAKASANVNLRNYDIAIEYADRGLRIAQANYDYPDKQDFAQLYHNKGVALTRKSDFHQAVLNFRKAINLYEKFSMPRDENYILLLNSIATTLYDLGQYDQCLRYYEEGISSLLDNRSYFAFYFQMNYSSVLCELNQSVKGEKVSADAFERLKRDFPGYPREYYVGLESYAGFLRRYRIDPSRSLELYRECFVYSKDHPWDKELNFSISLGYSLSLMENGYMKPALDSIRSILYRDIGMPAPSDLYSNPDLSRIRSDRTTLNILETKYILLRKLAKTEIGLSALENAASTAELIISVLEQIRLNLGDEESRILFGNRYREAYINIIQCYNDLFIRSSDISFLYKAFEYSERSKAASLLASIREMKAIQNYIPFNLADYERSVNKRILFYSAKLEEEQNLRNPLHERIDFWNDNLMSAIRERDSLRNLFEVNYPDYYSLKYNTNVINIAEAQKIVGKRRNYLSYVVSDSMVYMLVLNYKAVHLKTFPVDSAFGKTVLGFRKLLSEPNLNSNAEEEFRLFQSYGYSLFKNLINPVLDCLTSDELIISPDNTLSFFPFEALITSDSLRNDLYYSRLPYLMNDFRISYAYSVTLLKEAGKTRRSLHNISASFAPSYPEPVLIDSVSVNRQGSNGMLPDLKYAAEEASLVARLTSGVLYPGEKATRTAYLRVAGKNDILHLAMHTILNDRDPVNSGMIFSDDTTGSRFLPPYEIYSLRLNAKMVVLSSCYTGSGVFFAGEGVLSLARGFIFSGSRSVIMSLWEVDDRSGTDIISYFYKKLKTGLSKSESLRKARIKYLRKADMLQSHPYFWSTLVIYGDDSPLYISLHARILALLTAAIILLSVFFYLRKR